MPSLSSFAPDSVSNATAPYARKLRPYVLVLTTAFYLLFMFGCANSDTKPNKEDPTKVLKGGLLTSDAGLLPEVDSPPFPIELKDPYYPHELKIRGITGTVYFEYVIGVDGRASDIKILSSPHRLFSESVIDALRKSKFRPKRKNNVLVSTLIQQKIDFDLQYEAAEK